MIFDKTNLFSDQQAITGDAASTNVIDLGPTQTPKHGKKNITRDIGKGRKIDLRVQVTEAFNTLTSLTISVQTDSVENFASPKTVASVVVPLASLTVGYILPIDTVLRGTDERYVRLYYDVTGTDPTTGKITAGLVFGNEERGW